MKDSLQKSIIEGLLNTLKISSILSVIFIFIFKQFSLEGMVITFLVSFLYTFILGFGQGIINQFLNTKFDWVKQTNARVWAGIIGTVLYTIPAVLASNYLFFVVINGDNPNNFFKGQTVWTHLFYILISFCVSCFLHAREFMIAWKKAVEKETAEQQIVAKTETAKFETLKSQIDPHFLFNSLNVLTSLIGENPNQAEKFTTKLSKIYRYVLEQRNKELVPVQDELKFAKTYMELLQMRFEDAVTFEIQTDFSHSELKIVPLSLQLLLENAVKHNVVSSTKPLTVRIYEENGALLVENNKNPKDAIGKKSTKVGLQNIADRYGLLSSKQIKILNNNEVFSVSLPLLKQTENIMEAKINNINIQEKAEKHVAELRSFYSHLASYLMFCGFVIFINLRFSPNYHWFWFAIIGWGIGIISHALRAFEIPIFGRNWEERKIKEYVEKNS